MTSTGTSDVFGSLAGAMLTRIAVDDSLTLDLRRADGLSCTVRLDGNLRYTGASGASFEACIESQAERIGPLFTHLFERVDAVEIQANGALCLRFGHAELQALPHAHALAWKVSTSGGFAAACLEDGRVVTSRAEAA